MKPKPSRSWKPPEPAREYFERTKNEYIERSGSINQLDEKDQEILSGLEKLVTDLNMQAVWRKIARKKLNPETVCRFVMLGLLGPVRPTETMAPTKYDGWRSKVQEKALELAKLLDRTGYDNIAEYQAFRKYKKYQSRLILSSLAPLLTADDEDSVHRESEKRIADLHKHYQLLTPKKLSEYLEDIAYSEESDWTYSFTEREPPARIGRPNSKNAAKLHFKAIVKNEFRRLTNNPCIPIVDEIAEIIFS